MKGSKLDGLKNKGYNIVKFIVLRFASGGNIMDNLKKLNKVKTAKNAYRLIVESGRSVEDIALSLEISERLIYYWGAGKRLPNLTHIYGLSQLFDLPMESILA